MSEETKDFLQSHSIKFLEMAFRTDKCEIMASPDGYGKKSRDCGDFIEIYLKANGNILSHVSYYSNGCMNALSCANAVVFLSEGKPLSHAWKITPDHVANYLETLPEHDFHCAEMAVDALKQALLNLNELRVSPWKKVYRTRS